MGTRTTLQGVPGSMLEAMFSGRHEAQLEVDAGGRIFLDRDGQLFGHILSFLRQPSSARDLIASLSEREQVALRREADYFGLEDAMFLEETPHRKARIAVLGGQRDLVDGELDSMELLDLETCAFSLGPSMVTRRRGCACVMIDANRFVVVGGDNGTSPLDTTEIFDVATMAFLSGPRMRSKRWGCAAAMLDKNRLLVAGGHDGSNQLDTSEVLNLTTMVFEDGPSMTTGRRGCAGALLPGRAIVLGGDVPDRAIVLGGDDGHDDLNTTEILDLSSMTFKAGPAMHLQRCGCGATVLDSDRLLVVGGYNGSKIEDTTEVLDLTTMAFVPGPRMNTSRSGVATCLLDTGRILVAGGHDGSNHLPTTEILDLKTMSFAFGPTLGTGRSGPTAVCW